MKSKVTELRRRNEDLGDKCRKLELQLSEVEMSNKSKEEYDYQLSDMQYRLKAEYHSEIQKLKFQLVD